MMVWGSFAWSGVGELEFIDGIMTKEVYTDILKRKLRSSARSAGLSRNFIFQQDGDPKHTSKLATEWLKKNSIKMLDWVPQSPDLNPIENLWNLFKIKVADQKPSSLSQLKAILIEEWEKFDTQWLKNLVNSMPKRCLAVIKAKGAQIDY